MLGLLDHLIGADKQRGRDRKAKSLRRLEIENQLKLRRLLHGEVPRFRAPQDLVNVTCHVAVEGQHRWTIGY